MTQTNISDPQVMTRPVYWPRLWPAHRCDETATQWGGVTCSLAWYWGKNEATRKLDTRSWPERSRWGHNEVTTLCRYDVQHVPPWASGACGHPRQSASCRRRSDRTQCTDSLTICAEWDYAGGRPTTTPINKFLARLLQPAYFPRSDLLEGENKTVRVRSAARYEK